MGMVTSRDGLKKSISKFLPKRIWLVVYLPPEKLFKSDWIIIPTIGENKKCSKPPTRDVCKKCKIISENQSMKGSII
jgi:hypothetical protein